MAPINVWYVLPMAKKTLLLPLLISALSVFIACGGGGGGGIAIDDLDTEFAEALCDAQVRCGEFPDLASCLEATVIDSDQLKASVEAGRVDYDGDRMSECFAIIIDTSCDRIPTQVDENGTICDDTVTGTVALGGDCFGGECAGDAFCSGVDSDTCMQGICEAVELAAVGESCLEATCVDADCSDGICVARVPSPTVGQSCDDSVLFDCNGSLCISGTCVALPATGETCDPDFGGFGGFLSCGDKTEFCDFTDTTCKPRLAVGEACPEAPGNSCVAYAACDSGTCVAAPGLGDACGETTPRCLGDLDCDSGTCVAEPNDPVCTI